jgi:hypothetical protein
LGSPAGKDTLDKASGFGLTTPYEDSASSFSVAGGVLTAKSFQTNGWRSWRLRPPKIGTFYIEAVFHTTACSGADTYGLVVRAPDYASGQGYYLGLTCDGKFNFVSWTADKSTTLIPSTVTSAIQAGAGQTNRLGVKAKGDQFTLYINDQPVQDITDSAISGSGYYGIFVGGVTGGLSVDLDEIAYWNVP